MRFLIGLLIGLAIGFAGALLLSRQEGDEEELGWRDVSEEGPGEPAENHDFTAALRRAVRSLQTQAEEAWTEARQAAEEAERQMRDRYQRMAGRRPAGR